MKVFTAMRLAAVLGTLKIFGSACATPPPSPDRTPKPLAPAPPAPIIVDPGWAGAASDERGDHAFAPASPSAVEEVAVPVKKAVRAPDRTEEDQALDAGRRPELMLTYFGISPGMRVAELGAGRGYTAELLARVVGPEGKVYAQNSEFILSRFAEKPWSERLKKPVMKPVVRVDREFDDPLPPEADDLDAVLNVLFYHDTVWMGVDRAKMNRAIFDALGPGGIYGIVDHSAKQGAGIDDVKTLHRIEKKVIVGEVEAAGFELVGEADFLRNPDDARDWNAAPSAAGERRGESERFVLKFRKPATAR